MRTASKRKKKAIGYKRVSTEEQERYGNGLSTQEQFIREFSEHNDIELVTVFNEGAHSGKTKIEVRKVWEEALQYMADNDIKTLIVYSADRISRINWIRQKIIAEFKEAGLEIIAITNPDIMSDNPESKLLSEILGALSDYEASKIVAKMKDGIDAKAKRGEHATGSIPTGYKSVLVDGKKKMVIDEEQSEVIRIIFHLRDEKKLSYQKIADYLNDTTEYVPKRSKTGKWSKTTVVYIHENPKYKGIFTFHRDGDLLVETKNEELRILS